MCSPWLIFIASLHRVHNRLLQPDSKCDRQRDMKANALARIASKQVSA